MCLKSEGFASNLYDPEGAFTLQRFCAQKGLPYRDWGWPVPLAVLAEYGLQFQRRFVPDLEERTVTTMDRSGDGFLLRFEDGGTVSARRVILACGIGSYRHVPAPLDKLPFSAVSHSFDHHELAAFKGRDVTVVGAGSSALDLAGLLNEAGAMVRLVARRSKLPWGGAPLPEHRPLWQRIRYPMSGMAPGLRSRFYEDAPMLFRLLPRQTRLDIYHSFLGPAGPLWMKDRVEGRVSLALGRSIRDAEMSGARVRLSLAGNGPASEILTDHVIAATGFKINVRRLPFLAEPLGRALDVFEGAPVLSANFESSVRGLYFVGLPAAPTFGPLMRFMLGAGYTARRLSAHLAKQSSRGWSTSRAPAPKGAEAA
jgi:cation diffusion facilitator CzcD-associated flavoprotein CzcO